MRAADRAKKLTEEDKLARAEQFFVAGLRHEEKPETIPKAVRAYQKAITFNPQALGALINLGTIYYNCGDLGKAEECYRTALSVDPDYGLVYFNLGNVFEENNDLEPARRHYEQAVRLDPGYPDAHYNLALVYEKLGAARQGQPAMAFVSEAGFLEPLVPLRPPAVGKDYATPRPAGKIPG